MSGKSDLDLNALNDLPDDVKRVMAATLHQLGALISELYTATKVLSDKYHFGDGSEDLTDDWARVLDAIEKTERSPFFVEEDADDEG